MLSMVHARELELVHRRDEILRETANLTSNIVHSLEQQQILIQSTEENLHNQNVLLSLANDKMRAMNRDLTSVVDEMNEIEARNNCLCCGARKKKRKSKSNRLSQQQQQQQQQQSELKGAAGTIKTNKPPSQSLNTVSAIPILVANNEQEQMIVNEMNQMKNQLIVFQEQIETTNKSLDQGDEIIEQFSNETDRYMNAITVALNKAEHLAGRKFIVNQEQQQAVARERRPADFDVARSGMGSSKTTQQPLSHV